LRPSRVLGIASVVCLIIAVLTIALPLASVFYGAYKTGAGMAGTLNSQQSISPTSTDFSVPQSITLTNNGFLPLNGVYLNVVATSTAGALLFKITVGPKDIPAGGSTTFNIASANETAFIQDFGNSTMALGGTITFTAQVNLAGLVPMSVTGDVAVKPQNLTGAVP